MQHARVAMYKFRPGTADEAITKARAGLLPIHQGKPGFVAYGAVKTGDDGVVSISIWQTQAQAEDAVQASAAWVKDNIASLVESLQNHVGDLSFFAQSGTIGG